MEAQNTLILNEIRKNAKDSTQAIFENENNENIQLQNASEDLYSFLDEEDNIIEFQNCVDRKTTVNTANGRLNMNKRKSNYTKEIVKKRKIKIGLLKGKLTILPPDFKFPHMTCEQLI